MLCFPFPSTCRTRAPARLVVSALLSNRSVDQSCQLNHVNYVFINSSATTLRPPVIWISFILIPLMVCSARVLRDDYISYYQLEENSMQYLLAIYAVF